ncbi:class II fructose-bisphosphate aldolase [Candidatus Bipolaricaulota bacterium]|nr:class II fructose-bisphosphate aldolase [Candidatus Bipolaricaulota bacterium]
MPFAGGDSLREAYRKAEKNGFAFMANNIAEPTILLALLKTYADATSDLVVQISPGAAKYMGSGDKRVGLRTLCGIVHELAEAFPINVFINLDHFTHDEMDLIEMVIDERLVSSIMIDASKESFDENVRISRDVVQLASGSGILIEAELGKIKGVEDEIQSDEAFYTDPAEAVEFIRDTGADLLAISIGTQHGVSKGRNIELRTDIAGAIRDRFAEEGMFVPLVLHGSSGLLADQVHDVIRFGIRKLNKDTHYQYGYGRAACRFYLEHQHEILPPAGVEDDVINLFSGSEWSPSKKAFDPRAVGKAVQEGVSRIACALLEQAGSGGQALNG